jgi:hypothetical protein
MASGCLVCFKDELVLVLLLLVSLWSLIWFCGDFGQVEQLWLFFLFLLFLVFLPFGDSADELLGFLAVKRFYMNLCWLLWSTAWPGTNLVTPRVCVCCWACTRPGELLGCVCVHMLGIWLVSWLRDGSARQLWSYPFPFHLVSNLPSGYATWHNLCLLCLCAGSKWWSNGHDDLQAQD